VKERHIKNSDVRWIFQNAPTITDIITALQLTWLGKIAKMNTDRAPRKMIACWNESHRKPGRPQLNVRNTYVEALRKILPEMKNNGNLKHWMPELTDKNWNSEKMARSKNERK
jgi:hypothetical protein